MKRFKVKEIIKMLEDDGWYIARLKDPCGVQNWAHEQIVFIFFQSSCCPLPHAQLLNDSICVEKIDDKHVKDPLGGNVWSAYCVCGVRAGALPEERRPRPPGAE